MVHPCVFCAGNSTENTSESCAARPPAQNACPPAHLPTKNFKMVHPCAFWAANLTDETLRSPVSPAGPPKRPARPPTCPPRTSKWSICAFAVLETQRMKHFGILCRPARPPTCPPRTSKWSIRAFSVLETQRMKHFGIICRPPARPKRPPARSPAHQELQSGSSVRFLGWKLNG